VKKPKTRVVTRKAWGWYSPNTGRLDLLSHARRSAAERYKQAHEVVVRVTLTAEVPR